VLGATCLTVRHGMGRKHETRRKCYGGAGRYFQQTPTHSLPPLNIEEKRRELSLEPGNHSTAWHIDVGLCERILLDRRDAIS
jgi:hypothetical protein